MAVKRRYQPRKNTQGPAKTVVRPADFIVVGSTSWHAVKEAFPEWSAWREELAQHMKTEPNLKARIGAELKYRTRHPEPTPPPFDIWYPVVEDLKQLQSRFEAFHSSGSTIQRWRIDSARRAHSRIAEKAACLLG